jgi:tRNA-specific adenosine deaminase 3
MSKPVEHLNPYGLQIRATEEKGRGVYGKFHTTDVFCDAEEDVCSIASRPIPAQTLLEVSPVLLFEKDEYEKHGRHTIVDHYTYKWKDGKMALALGLGAYIPCFSFEEHLLTES